MIESIQKIIFKERKKTRADRVENPSKYGALVLPIAHYAIVNSKYMNHVIKPKIVIYGLGSCIALILYDIKKLIYSMSHILLPSNKSSDNNISLPFPHKFADHSVKELVRELLSHGAKHEHIRAIVIGGASIFQNIFNDISSRNIKTVKNELKALNIKIIKEDTGGTRGRTVIIDTYDNTVLIKTSSENEYKINL